MPGFDGTGPRGMGPMTGGGRGFCRPSGVLRRPFGGGFGLRPRGRGYARYGVQPFYPGNAAAAPAEDFNQDVASLRQQASDAKAHLEELEARIQQLEEKS